MIGLTDDPRKSTPSTKGSGYLLAVTSSLGSGAAVVVGKWNLQAISPLLMNALIFSIATVLLAAWVMPTRGMRETFHLSGRGWLWLSLFTISSWLAIWAFWAGVRRMDPSLAAFLARTEVLVAVVLGIILLKERFTGIETAGAVASIIGIVIMRLTLRMEYSLGFTLVLLGSLLFGITEFVSKIAVRHVEPVVLAYIRNMFMALAYWVVVIAIGTSFEGLDDVWLGVLALGALGPIMSRMVYLMALKRLELSKVAVISQSQPVFVVIIAMLALGQLPTTREAAGGLLLISGCLVMILSRYRNRNRRLGPSRSQPDL